MTYPQVHLVVGGRLYGHSEWAHQVPTIIGGIKPDMATTETCRRCGAIVDGSLASKHRSFHSDLDAVKRQAEDAQRKARRAARA